MSVTFDPFQQQSQRQGRGGLRPIPADIYRDGDSYVLNAELPGVDPASIDLDIDGHQLTIRATKSVRGEIEGGDVRWLVRERRGGSFIRQLTLGQNIDTERIAASYDNGVLTVTIPVAERAKPRRIEIARTATLLADAEPAGAEGGDAEAAADRTADTAAA